MPEENNKPDAEPNSQPDSQQASKFDGSVAEERIKMLTRQINEEKTKREQDKQDFNNSIDILKDMYEKVEGSVNSIEASTSLGDRPDPNEDMGAFLDWQEKKTKTALQNAIQETTKKFQPKQISGNGNQNYKSTPSDVPSESDTLNKLFAMQMESQPEIYPDYEKFTQVAYDAAQKDRSGYLVSTWKNSGNPILAAYNYGKQSAGGNGNNASSAQAYTESGRPSGGSTKEVQLTEADKAMAKKLGIDEKALLKRKQEKETGKTINFNNRGTV